MPRSLQVRQTTANKMPRQLPLPHLSTVHLRLSLRIPDHPSSYVSVTGHCFMFQPVPATHRIPSAGASVHMWTFCACLITVWQPQLDIRPDVLPCRRSQEEDQSVCWDAALAHCRCIWPRSASPLVKHCRKETKQVNTSGLTHKWPGSADCIVQMPWPWWHLHSGTVISIPWTNLGEAGQRLDCSESPPVYAANLDTLPPHCAMYVHHPLASLPAEQFAPTSGWLMRQLLGLHGEPLICGVPRPLWTPTNSSPDASATIWTNCVASGIKSPLHSVPVICVYRQPCWCPEKLARQPFTFSTVLALLQSECAPRLTRCPRLYPWTALTPAGRTPAMSNDSMEKRGTKRSPHSSSEAKPSSSGSRAKAQRIGAPASLTGPRSSDALPPPLTLFRDQSDSVTDSMIDDLTRHDAETVGTSGLSILQANKFARYAAMFLRAAPHFTPAQFQKESQDFEATISRNLCHTTLHHLALLTQSELRRERVPDHQVRYLLTKYVEQLDNRSGARTLPNPVPDTPMWSCCARQEVNLHAIGTISDDQNGLRAGQNVAPRGYLALPYRPPTQSLLEILYGPCTGGPNARSPEIPGGLDVLAPQVCQARTRIPLMERTWEDIILGKRTRSHPWARFKWVTGHRRCYPSQARKRLDQPMLHRRSRGRYLRRRRMAWQHNALNTWRRLLEPFSFILYRCRLPQPFIPYVSGWPTINATQTCSLPMQTATLTGPTMDADCTARASARTSRACIRSDPVPERLYQHHCTGTHKQPDLQLRSHTASSSSPHRPLPSRPGPKSRGNIVADTRVSLCSTSREGADASYMHSLFSAKHCGQRPVNSPPARAATANPSGSGPQRGPALLFPHFLSGLLSLSHLLVSLALLHFPTLTQGHPILEHHARPHPLPIASAPADTSRIRKRSFLRACRRAQALGETKYRGRLLVAASPSTPVRVAPSKYKQRMSARSDAKRIQVMSLNAGGLPGAYYDEVMCWLEQSSVDILLVQESHWGFEREWTSPNFTLIHSGSQEHRHGGLLTIVRKTLSDPQEIRHSSIIAGRLQHVRIPIGNISLDIFNVYQHVYNSAKPDTLTKREQLWRALSKSLGQLPKRNHLLVGGDWNVHLDPYPKCIGPKTWPPPHDRAPDFPLVNTLLADRQLCMLNTWSGSKAKPTFSWGSYQSQIDFLAVKQLHADSLARCAGPVPRFVGLWRNGANHLAVQGSLSLKWRPWYHTSKTPMNVIDRELMIQDAKAKQPSPRLLAFREELSTELSKHQSSLHTLHELVYTLSQKYYCKEERSSRPLPHWQQQKVATGIKTMWGAYNFFKNCRRDRGMRGLIAAWKAWARFRKLHAQHKANSKEARAKKIRTMLEDAQTAADRHDLRGLYQIVNKLAPKNVRKRTQLRGANHVLLDPAEEARAFADHFKARFQAESPADIPAGAVCLVTHGVQLSAQDIAAKLRQVPLRKAVPHLRPPSVVWRLCPTMIADYLCKAHNASQCPGRLPSIPRPWSDTDLALILKAGKPGKSPADFRPIGLTCQLGKAVTAAVGDRIRPYVEDLVRQYPQYAYMAGRSHRGALRRVAHFLHTAHLQQQATSHKIYDRFKGAKPGALCGTLVVSLDLSQAFDRVPRQRLAEVMLQAHVPEDYIAWLLQLHAQCHCHVRHGDHHHEFATSRGVRQGCCIAPLLYLLFSALEGKACDEAIRPGWSAERLTLFADDHLAAWRFEDIASLEQALRELRVLFRVLLSLGMIANPDKSQVLFTYQGTQSAQIRKKHTCVIDRQRFLKLGEGPNTVLLPIGSKISYLGVTLTATSSADQTMSNRLGKGWSMFKRIKKFLTPRSNITLSHRLALWRACVWSTSTYGIDSVGINHKGAKKLRVAVLKQLRYILGSPAHIYHQSNQDILLSCSMSDPVQDLENALLKELGKQTNPLDAFSNRPSAEWRAELIEQFANASTVPDKDPEPQLPPKTHACKFCGVYFATRASMKAHLTRMHPDQAPASLVPFSRQADSSQGLPICQHCNHHFPTWSSLAIHITGGHCASKPIPSLDNTASTSECPECPALINDNTVRDSVRQAGPSAVLTWKATAVHLQKYCGFCGTWLIDISKIKQHFRHSHPALLAAYGSETAKLVKSTNSQGYPCLLCGSKAKPASAHKLVCPVLWQGTMMCLHILRDLGCQDDGTGPVSGMLPGRPDVRPTCIPSCAATRKNGDGRNQCQTAKDASYTPTGERQRPKRTSTLVQLWPQTQAGTAAAAPGRAPPSCGSGGSADGLHGPLDTAQCRGNPAHTPGLRMAHVHLEQCHHHDPGDAESSRQVARRAQQRHEDWPDTPAHMPASLSPAVPYGSASTGYNKHGLAETGDGQRMAGQSECVEFPKVGPNLPEADPGYLSHPLANGKSSTGSEGTLRAGERPPSPAKVPVHSPDLPATKGTCSLDAHGHLGPDQRSPKGPRTPCPASQQLSASTDRMSDQARALAQIRFEPRAPVVAGRVLGLTLSNTTSFCYMNASFLLVSWLFCFLPCHLTEWLGTSGELWQLILATPSRRVTLSSHLRWRVLLSFWRERKGQQDAAEFLSLLGAKHWKMGLKLKWQARCLVESDVLIEDSGWDFLLRIPSGSGPRLSEQVIPLTLDSLIAAWHQQARSHALCEAPEAILLQLPRFCVRQSMHVKDHTPINIRPDFRLPIFTDDQSLHVQWRTYTAVGAICHFGPDLHSGHYNCWLREGARQWQTEDNREAVACRDCASLDGSCYVIAAIRASTPP